ATVVVAAGAAVASQPSTVVAAMVPVTTGAWVSSTLIVCTTVAVFPQASAMVYVLVITNGQVPDEVCVEVTTRFASAVHASAIVIPNASNCATVVAAAGAAVASQPSTVVAAMVPVTTGAWVSSTLIVCTTVAVFPQASAMVYVLVITNGQVPDEVCVEVTTRF